MGAANAAAANAAMDKKKTEHLEGLIREVTDRWVSERVRSHNQG
jgi:hypothetical protein